MMYNLYTMQNTQPLARTQIYLTEIQQSRLEIVSRRASVTKSELIRRAVDQFLDQQTPASATDKAHRLGGIAGLWVQRSDMVDPAAYLRKLRAPRFAREPASGIAPDFPSRP